MSILVRLVRYWLVVLWTLEWRMNVTQPLLCYQTMFYTIIISWDLDLSLGKWIHMYPWFVIVVHAWSVFSNSYRLPATTWISTSTCTLLSRVPDLIIGLAAANANLVSNWSGRRKKHFFSDWPGERWVKLFLLQRVLCSSIVEHLL